MYTNMEYRAARDYLLGQTAPLDRLERKPLLSANGRVLAEQVTAVGDVPPFARSPYDG